MSLKYSLRPAKAKDAEGIAKVQVDTWRHTYRGIVPDSFLEDFTYESRTARHRARLEDPAGAEFSIVAEDSKASVAAFAFGGPVRNEDVKEYGGELFAVYVLPDHQRHGLGKRLVRAVADGLHEQGFTAMMLWVLRDNPWRAFYDRIGGEVIREISYELGGRKLPKLGYGWKDIHVLRRL